MANQASKNTSIVRTLMGVEVVATGSYAPEPVVTNEDLAPLGFDPDWIFQRTGIRQRRQLPAHLATSDMALEAGRRCIARAGASKSDIDLVIVCTFTPDMLVPATACAVQDRLGLRAGAMDVNSACAGFVYGLITGMQYVATGSSRLALVIGADCNTRITDCHDKKIYPLFGDGAGAVLLGPGSSEQGMLAYTLGSDGSGTDLLYRAMGGSRIPPSPQAIASRLHVLKMDGRAVFKWAIRILDETVHDVLRHASLAIDDLDLVVLHQANQRIIDAAADHLGLDRRKMYNNLENYGNTSGGSIPLALDEAYDQGRIRRGDRILISGYGAGLAWGTAILQW
jgi:3-oxoacyl-[acyl-carrier-protein] synthase-3